MAKAIELREAECGGHVVIDVTTDPGLIPSLLFAGDLDACLTFLKEFMMGEKK